MKDCVQKKRINFFEVLPGLIQRIVTEVRSLFKGKLGSDLLCCSLTEAGRFNDSKVISSSKLPLHPEFHFTLDSRTDLAFQNIFNCSAWNHYGFVFNNDIQLIAGNWIAPADGSKNIDTKPTGAGIPIEHSALFFNCRPGFVKNFLRCPGKTNTEITFRHSCFIDINQILCKDGTKLIVYSA